MPNGDHSQPVEPLRDEIRTTFLMVERLLDARERRIRELEAENEDLRQRLAAAVGQLIEEQADAR